jgi:predicted CoA-substrate-specific enzyme activase
MEIEKPKVDYVVDQINDPKIPTPKGLLKYGKLTGENKSETAEQAYDEALKQLQLKRSDFERVWATGIYRKQVLFATHVIPGAVANAHGVLLKVRNAKTILDVGAEGCRVIRISQDGKVMDIALSDKTPMGMGLLNEKAAQLLGMTTQELADAALKSTNSIFQNGKYSVFGEAEVSSLINQKIQKNDIARAVYDSICARVAAVARITGLEDDVAIVGGMAKNGSFVQVLKQAIGKDIKEPHNTDFVCAFGAAVAAAAVEVDEELRKKRK